MNEPKPPLWQQVKIMEESHNPEAQKELGMVRATLLVNHGPNGQNKKIIKSENESVLKMLIDVLSELQKDPDK